MINLDEHLFLAINGFVGKFRALDNLMAFLVNDYFVPLLLSLLLLALWFAGETPERRLRLQSMVLWSAGGIGIASGLVKLANIFFFRPRPFGYLPATMLFYQPHDSSFPSNAIAVAFAAAMGIWLGHRRMGAVVLPAATLFAFARVYTGIHFPLDAAGGVVLGLASGYLAYWICKTFWQLPYAMIWLARLFRVA